MRPWCNVHILSQSCSGYFAAVLIGSRSTGCVFLFDTNAPFQKTTGCFQLWEWRSHFSFFSPSFPKRSIFLFAPKGPCSGFSLEPRGSSFSLASPRGLRKLCVASDKSVAFYHRRDHRRCSTDLTPKDIFPQRISTFAESVSFIQLGNFELRLNGFFVSDFMCYLSSESFRFKAHSRRLPGLVNICCFSEDQDVSVNQGKKLVDFWNTISHDDFDAVSGIGIHDSVVDSHSFGFGWRSVGWVSSTGIRFNYTYFCYD